MVNFVQPIPVYLNSLSSRGELQSAGNQCNPWGVPVAFFHLPDYLCFWPQVFKMSPKKNHGRGLTKHDLWGSINR